MCVCTREQGECDTRSREMNGERSETVLGCSRTVCVSGIFQMFPSAQMGKRQLSNPIRHTDLVSANKVLLKTVCVLRSRLLYN